MDTQSRRQAYLTHRIEFRFREEVEAWSQADETRLPTRGYLRNQLDEELEVLIRALGPWADVHPSEIFGEDAWFFLDP